MKTKDLIKTVASETKISQGIVRQVIYGVSDVIKDRVSAGDKVYIFGLGTFDFRNRAPRAVQNVDGSGIVFIPGHMVPHFTPSKEFKEAVGGNDGKHHSETE